MPEDPTIPPPEPDSLNSSLRRNIEAHRRRRQEEEAQQTLHERVAANDHAIHGQLEFRLCARGDLRLLDRCEPRLDLWH
jgi:hypothetical protein